MKVVKNGGVLIAYKNALPKVNKLAVGNFSYLTAWKFSTFVYLIVKQLECEILWQFYNRIKI